LLAIVIDIKSLLFVVVVAATASCSGTHHEPAELTPLMSAASNGNAVRVRQLIAAGADVNEPRGLRVVPGGRIEGDSAPQGETALMFAVDAGDLDTIRVLLDAGARTDVRANWGNNVWERLRRRLSGPNAVEILRLLLSRSPRIPPDLATAMLADAMSGANEAVVSIVLDQVEDPMAAYCFTAAPLDDAHFSSMMRLLEKRIGVPKGRALECGVGVDTPLKLEYFLKHGANPNQVYNSFRPLSSIAFDVSHGYGLTNDRREMVKLLLRYGANPALREDNTSRGSPIDMARSAGNTELLGLLTQGTARR
jgi:ankyrin repeat protein